MANGIDKQKWFGFHKQIWGMYLFPPLFNIKVPLTLN